MAIDLSEERLIGSFSTGEDFPFSVINDKLVFDPHFLEKLSLHPAPYGELSLNYQPYLSPDKMKDITDWFVQYPKENVLKWVSGASTATNLLHRFRGTHRAMALMCEGEIGYNALYRKGKEPKNQEDYLVGRFFLEHVVNCQGIRNRTILTKAEVAQSIGEQLADGQKVRIMSVASGTSAAVLGAASQYSEQGYKNSLSLLAVDISNSALDDSEQAAKRIGLDDIYNRRQNDFRAVKDYAGDFKPTIVEVCGLLDYFDDSELVTFLNALRGSMDEKGVVIFSSVMPNYETPFIEASVDWPFMYERTESNMKKITQWSGFALGRSRFVVDPLRRHCLAVVKIA